MRPGRCSVRDSCLIIFLLLSACKPSSDISLPDGADFEWAALLELDENGAVVASSELLPWPKDQGLAIYAEHGADAVFVGWSAADLAADISLEQLLQKRPRLEAAVGCRQKLLPPKYSARWSGDSFEPLAVEDLPPLAILGEELACPELVGKPLALDLRCEVGRCAPVVTYLSRCTARLDLESCGYGIATATFDREGQACLDLSLSSLDCTPRVGDRSSNAAHLCDAPVACPLDLYLDPSARPAPFEVEHVKLFDAPPYFARLAGTTPILSRGGIFSGYAYDLTVSGAQMVVSVSENDDANANCGEHIGGRFFFLELESLELTHTSSAPHCVRHVVNSESPDRFFAAYFVEGTGWRLAEFDTSGRELRAVALDLPTAFEHVNELRRQGSNLILLCAEEGEGNIVLVHDTNTLAERKRYDLRMRLNADSMSLVDADTILMAADNTREIVWFNIESGADEARIGLEGDTSFYHDLIDVVPGPIDDRALAFGRGRANVFAVDRSGRAVDELTVFERDTVGLNAIRWPHGQFGPATVLVSAVEVITWQSYGVLLDAGTGRFFPGMVKLGHGPAVRPVQDGSGRDYFLLPWAAEIVRVTPR
jgi:hypothetical protein